MRKDRRRLSYAVPVPYHGHRVAAFKRSEKSRWRRGKQGDCKGKAKLEEAIKPYTEKLAGISAENEKLINGKLDIIQTLINKETGNLIK